MDVSRRVSRRVRRGRKSRVSVPPVKPPDELISFHSQAAAQTTGEYFSEGCIKSRGKIKIFLRNWTNIKISQSAHQGS